MNNTIQPLPGGDFAVLCNTCISPQPCTNEGRCYKMEKNNFPRALTTPRSGDMQAVAAAIDSAQPAYRVSVEITADDVPGALRSLKAWQLRRNPEVEATSAAALGLWCGSGRSERSYSFFDRVPVAKGQTFGEWARKVDDTNARALGQLPDLSAPYGGNRRTYTRLPAQPNGELDKYFRQVDDVPHGITMEPNEDDEPGGRGPIVSVRYDLSPADTESELRKAMVARGWVTPEAAEQARTALCSDRLLEAYIGEVRRRLVLMALKALGVSPIDAEPDDAK